jgi:hypothetical protein
MVWPLALFGGRKNAILIRELEKGHLATLLMSIVYSISII